MKVFVAVLIIAVSLSSCLQQAVPVTSSPEEIFVVHQAPGNRGIITPGKVRADFDRFNQFTFIKSGYCPCVRTYDGSGTPEAINCELFPIEPIDNLPKIHTLGIMDPDFDIEPYTLIYDSGSYGSLHFHKSWAARNNLYYDFKTQIRGVFKQYEIPYKTMTEKTLEANIQPDIRYYLIPTVLDMWCSQKGLKRGCKINVEWKIYDSEFKETSHIFYSVGGGVSDYTTKGNILGAMYNATECLMNNPAFLDFMGTEYASNQRTSRPSAYKDSLHISSVATPSALEKAALMEEVLHSFVSIRTEKKHGSGVALSKDGYILTSASLVHNARIIEVHEHSGEFEIAIAERVDLTHNVALLKIADARDMYPAPLDLSNRVAVNDTVIVVSANNNPDLENRATQAIINGEETVDDIRHLLIRPAPRKAGSGGPVFNTQGQLIGIVHTGIGNSQDGYVLPISKVLEALKITVKAPELEDEDEGNKEEVDE